jgi:hypothetical protein
MLSEFCFVRDQDRSSNVTDTLHICHVPTLYKKRKRNEKEIYVSAVRRGKLTSKRCSLWQYVMNFEKSTVERRMFDRSRLRSSRQTGYMVGRQVGTTSQRPERLRRFLHRTKEA